MLKEFVWSKSCDKCKVLSYIIQKYYSKEIQCFTNTEVLKTTANYSKIIGYPFLKIDNIYIFGRKAIIKYLKFPRYKYQLLRFWFWLKEKLCLV